MATTAQIAANRQNALNSTGPKSLQGKAVVAQNAVKLGLTAHHSVIKSESKAEFDLYRQQFLEELTPDTPLESMLAERIVNLSWRLKRIALIQSQTFDALNKSELPGPLSSLKDFLNKHQDESAQSAQNLPLGRLAIRDFSNQRILERLLMYERRLENSLYKTVLELQRLNLMKNLKTNRNILADYTKQTQYA
ncbi:MAG: hypothetical protein WC374_11945 [Phycisphaerae bacterium]|jgi:hypothetical protein